MIRRLILTFAGEVNLRDVHTTPREYIGLAVLIDDLLRVELFAVSACSLDECDIHLPIVISLVRVVEADETSAELLLRADIPVEALVDDAVHDLEQPFVVIRLFTVGTHIEIERTCLTWIDMVVSAQALELQLYLTDRLKFALKVFHHRSSGGQLSFV